ncbi:TniB family NTP-binding protein [Nitrospirillum pindoramense]|uniref:TniB protein n=1 Tax=Nitrospirillum amazonense TaxID=28077 RepID=A0A560GU10_9PROT|nr:TniB family NTP-binding protein [Nitrospirillum amazonense]TWB36920.1 TniB protein [Nitrospirillum amazonense]
MTDYSHLHSSTVPLLDLSNAERVFRCQTKRYVNYPRAKQIMAKLEHLLVLPHQQRPECLIVEAPTSNGKSYLLKEFLRRHPAVDDPKGDSGIIPVLFIEVTGDPSLETFYEWILDALSVPFNRKSHRRIKRHQCILALKMAGTRIVIMDETHNLALASFAERMKILAEMRSIMNDDTLMISFVCAGTGQAKSQLQSDAQLLNRHEVAQLPLWKDDGDYRALLAGFESLLPLRQPSGLWEDDALAGYILERSERLIAGMFYIVSRAATEAIRSGEERITRKILERVDYQPPSKRRVTVVDLDVM